MHKYFNPFIKIGAHRWDNDTKVEASYRNISASDSASDDGIDMFFGIGFNVALDKSFGLRAEWEKFKTSLDLDVSDEIDLVTVSLIYKF